ncbi:MAG: LPS assembly lipoprotein LptE [Minwuiales bacterium]|nr:LPS assembly lipoprotein LptE [Minwuiales bacterium]
MWSKALAAFLLLGTLAACGFEPLYGNRIEQGPAGPAMAATYVAPIPDRIGQQVRNNLLDRLNPAGIPDRPLYTLQIALSADKEGLAIRQDETVTRFNLTLQAEFALVDRAQGKPVFRGKTRSIAAYNVVESPFATLIAEQDAEARAAREISEEIRNQVALYFASRGQT